MFAESSLVWVPDSQAKFVPARVVRAFAPGEPGRVALLDDSGKTSIFEIDLDPTITSGLMKMDKESLGSETFEDMVNLRELNDASILHNLRVRFQKNEIYTSIGDVLVAINPFKLLPIYTPLLVDHYIATSSQSNSKPHIFKTADEAFVRLISNKRDQACMVTGESGSGKTETTKLFLQYLAQVSSTWSAAGMTTSSFELSDRILKANPLLESLGNAVTRKNHNSSRFGKMISVSLDTTSCEITEAKTTIFLLEKSRLPIQDKGERNFHIFYQLCAAAKFHTEIQQRYQVLDVSECRYLAFGQNNGNATNKDLIQYEVVQKSMTVLKFSPKTQAEIFRIVSAILHLGNLEFVQDESVHNCEASMVSSKTFKNLEIASTLLGLPELDILHSNLCSKSVQAGGKDSVKQPQSLDKSRKSRDALAIHLYSSLFEFVTQQVNLQFSNNNNNNNNASPKKACNRVGVLDIFGFEAFDGPHNSFEQLCINYCNEKLQQTFNEHMFTKEKILYEQENLTKVVNLTDMLLDTHKNSLGVLDMFEKPRTGLFAVLDEECNIPTGSDLGFLKKMNAQQHVFYQHGKKNLSDSTFVVKHYVGPVVYVIKNILEKNDGGFLSRDLQLLCGTSSLAILSQLSLLTSSTSSSSTMTSNLKVHLASQFANQLDVLVRELSEMEPTFVRCIKPNYELKPASFNAGMVLEQLRCAGILEVCRIRQLGLPVRRTFSEFIRRFGVLVNKGVVKKFDHHGVEDIIRRLNKAEDTPLQGYYCGKTLVFMKNQSWAILETKLSRLRQASTVKIQRRIRGNLARKKTRVMKLALIKLRSAMAQDDVEEMHQSLAELSRALSGDDEGGKHLHVVQQAWKQLSRLEELRWSLNLISTAIASRDSHQIRSALNCTASIVPANHVKLTEAKQALLQLSEGDECVKQLSLAVLDSNISLETFSALFDRVQHEFPFLLDTLLKDKALAKLAVLEDAPIVVEVVNTTSTFDRLREVVAMKDPVLLAKQIVILIQNGLESHPEAQAAIQVEKTMNTDLQDDQELSHMVELLELRSDREGGGDTDLVVAGIETIGKRNTTLKPKTDKLLKEATDKMEAQNKLTEILNLGEANTEFGQVRAALERAYAVGLTTGETVYRVQKIMRSKNRERRLAKKRVVIDVQGAVPEKLSLKMTALRGQSRNERDGGDALILEAREDRYLLPHYFQLRSSAQILCQQHVVVLLETTSEHLGEMVSKLILGYTGEKTAAFPSTCAHSLLEIGQTSLEAGDEVYCQIMAHLTENLSSESATRSWQLLCLAIGSFYPSGDLLFFLVRFLVDRAEGRTDASLPALAPPRPKLSTNLDTYTLEQRYAYYALKRLQRDLSNEVVNDQLPTSEEITAFGERVPLVTNVTYPDGSLLLEDVIISPLFTCQEIVNQCLFQAGLLQAEIGPSYGLFARPVDKTSVATVVTVGGPDAAHEDNDNDDEEDLFPSAATTQTKKPSRFRLSITAVFGLAALRGNNYSPRGSESSEAPPQKQRKSSSRKPTIKSHAPPSTVIRRTEEDLDWDVPLMPSDFVSDVLLKYLRAGRGAPRLVFKKRIFVPEFEKLAEDLRKAEPEINRSTTQAIARIELVQAIDDFSTGALPFDKEDEVLEIVGCRVALKFDNRLPSDDPDRLMQIGQVESLIPVFWKSRKTEINWARALLEKKGRVNGKEVSQLQDMVLKRCQSRPLYGMQIFRVRERKEAANDAEPMSVLACSKIGFIHLSSKEYKVLHEFRFEHIHEYGLGKTNLLFIRLKNTSTMWFQTSHAKEMVEIANEYESVAAVLQSLLGGETPPPPSVEFSPKSSFVTNLVRQSEDNNSTKQYPTAMVRGMEARKATTTHRGSQQEMDFPDFASNHSIREQMQKLGATEKDINQVLRVNASQEEPVETPLDKLKAAYHHQQQQQQQQTKA